MLQLHSGQPAETEPVFTAEQILDVQWRLAEVYGTENLLEYIVDLVEASRQHPDIYLGGSPRASLCLLRCARARALLDGRHYFTHEDVQAVALGVLGHRLILRPEAEVEGRRSSDVVRELLGSVAVLRE
jgi:MoxR-like ATPase